MRVWGKLTDKNRVHTSAIIEIDERRIDEVEDFAPAISELCRELDLSCPVILKKHTAEIIKFRHTTFKAPDFLEPFGFRGFVVEFLAEDED